MKLTVGIGGRGRRAAALFAALLLGACASGPLSGGPGGIFQQKVGRPYQINGVWYYPQADNGYDQVGIASWYGEPFHGRETANGETYDMEAMTAAHTTLPLPTFVEVTNLENRASVVVKINDRGPFVDGRLIDMSRAAARQLGFVDKGLARVRVRIVDPPPGVTLVSAEPVSTVSVPPPVQTRPKPIAMAMATAPLPDPYGKTASGAGDGLPQAPAGDLPAARGMRPPDQMAASGATTNQAQVPMAPVYSAPPVQPANGRFQIQAGVFGDLGNARNLQGRLRGIGPVSVTPVAYGQRTLHRVRLGPYASRESANAALDAVRASGLSDALIVVE